MERAVSHGKVGDVVVTQRTNARAVARSKVAIFNQGMIGVTSDIVVPSREIDVMYIHIRAVHIDSICIVRARVRFLAHSCGGWCKDFDPIELAKVTAKFENVVRAVGVKRLVQHCMLNVAEVYCMRTEHLLFAGLLHINPPLQPLPVHSACTGDCDVTVVLCRDDGGATALPCCGPALLIRRCKLQHSTRHPSSHEC